MRVMFLGYNPLWYKLFIWVLAAIVCGMAGALYVPQVGIINPSEMATANSIEIAIWTSIGGRGTLVGPARGAIVVNLSKSWFTVAFPEYWLYFLGLMFVFVTMFFSATVEFDPGLGVYYLIRGGYFIQKLDWSRNLLWAKGSQGTVGRSITTNP